MVQWDPETQQEILKKWQEELMRQMKRGAKAMELFLRPSEPEVGQTPRDLI